MGKKARLRKARKVIDKLEQRPAADPRRKFQAKLLPFLIRELTWRR